MVEYDARRLLVRVDPRLVHGALVNAWVERLAAAFIVVADARVAANPRQRTIFEMSAMELAKVVFVPEA